MPINIPKNLPAAKTLKEEKIFVMDSDRAVSQDIRPLNILILNLMPEKERTELQLLRLLGNTPLQVNVTFMAMASHESKNTSKSHLDAFYLTFEEIRHRKFDGMIITGAPIEHLDFEKVNYWAELKEILDWSDHNVTSLLNICWGAQAALYHFYGIGKRPLPEKCFGVYRHTISDPTIRLARGFNDLFVAPHSRHTEVDEEEVRHHPELVLLSESDEAGAFIIISKDERRIMITGHLEYDADTLAIEYRRDRDRGLGTAIPEHYFPEDDPENIPLNTWRSHTFLLFSNWLNYYVYQETPYVWE